MENWSPYVEVITNKKSIILANRENGQWIRMSEDSYNIVREIVNCGKEIYELKKCFEDESDYDYILKLYQCLTEGRILIPSELKPSQSNRIASLQLTNRCNLRCKHCCVSAGEDVPEDLDTNTMKEILVKLVQWDPANIMLSGGEPLMRKDFFELLVFLRSIYSGSIIVSTNALLITKENVSLLISNCDRLEISIDGVDEASCSQIRGKGVFDKVCKKIELLHSHGFHNINLSMVFADKNEYLQEEFKNLNRRLGTTPVCRSFTPVGRGQKNKNIFTEKGDEDVYIPSDYLVDDYKDAFGVSVCTAGKKEIFVTCEGYIQPCPTYADKKYSIGNILEIDNLQDYLNMDKTEYVSKTILKDYPYNLEKCKECPVKLFCWTCPGELLNVKHKSAFEKRCSILKPILMKRVWESEIDM